MAATNLLYATAAIGTSPGGKGSTWGSSPGLALGAPNGQYAVNTNRGVKEGYGYQRLTLGGYDPQAAILAADGNRVPYSLDHLHVQVTFTADSVHSLASVDVLLLDSTRATIATAPLYLDDAGPGVVADSWVTFTGHNGFDDQQPLTWDDLADCQVALDVRWSEAGLIGTAFLVDAVGMYVSYTVDPPHDVGQAPAAIEVRTPGDGVSLRVYDRNSTRLGTLPWSSLSTTIVRNELGALAASVPKGLIKAGLLDGERYLRVAVDGVESQDWFLLDDDGDDDADEGGPMRPVAIGGSGAAGILDWGIVYSWQYDPADGDLLNLEPRQGFAGKTPGRIFGSLIDQAQARGCFPHLSYSFTDDVDSAGRAWPTTYSKAYDIGTTLLKVVTMMGEDGWVDWEMVGFRLDLYVPDTALALDRPDVVLRLGKGVTQAPRKRTRKATRSVLLANGGEGATVEVDDGAAVATWGRREAYEGRGSITDLGTLRAATQVSLARRTTAFEALTLELDPYAMPEEAPALPRPGGYIRYDQRRQTPTKLEPLRLQSLAVDYGDNKVSVELNDLWVEGDIKRARQLDAILNGSSANERVPAPQDAPDTLAPGPVAGLALNSTAYVAPDGTLGAQMTATWAEVTQNADGSPIRDLLGYDIEYRQLDVMPGQHTFRTRVTTLAQWSPVVPGQPIDARIRAVDRYENPGAWSGWETIVAGDDVTPPAVPTKPEVDNYLGLLRTRWDGTFADGTARTADLAAVEVHVSSLDGFDPNEDPEATRVGTMYASGAVFTDTPYGAQRYVRLVAVDTTGNRSAPSEQASGATGPVVSADVFDGAIGSSKLADLAVVTAKIADLAVNNAKIGSVEVGKVTAGVVNAEWIMGGRIATAATGQRVELNSLGIFRWNAAGDLTVAIDDNGALLTGTYKTALTGRRVEIGVTAGSGAVIFYGANGERSLVRSTSAANFEGTVEETIELTREYSDSFTRHRIQLGASGWTSMTARSGTNIYSELGTFSVNRGDGTVNGSSPLLRYEPTDGIWELNVGSRATMASRSGGTVTFESGGDAISPVVSFISGSSPYGQGSLRFWQNGSGHRLEVLNTSRNAYLATLALRYDLSSDADGKDNITAADGGELLSAVRGTPVRRYQRKQVGDSGAGKRLGAPRLGPVETGLVAQETPEWVRGQSDSFGRLTVDLYAMASTNWGATGHLADIVEAQGRQIEELTAQLAALTKGTK